MAEPIKTLRVHRALHAANEALGQLIDECDGRLTAGDDREAETLHEWAEPLHEQITRALGEL